MGDKIDFENRQIYRQKFKMAAVTVSATIDNKVLMIISSKFDHADLIGNHYSRSGGKIKKNKEKVAQDPSPSHLPT